MKRRCVFFLALMLSVLLLSGCSFQQKYDQHVANDDKTLNSFLNSEVIDYSVYKDEVDVNAQDAKVYFDEKSGQMVTEAQYKAYSVVDNIKYYGFWIALGSFSIGFIIRRFVQNSVNVRRFGILLEVAIPVVYVLLAYIGSYVADRI